MTVVAVLLVHVRIVTARSLRAKNHSAAHIAPPSDNKGETMLNLG